MASEYDHHNEWHEITHGYPVQVINGELQYAKYRFDDVDITWREHLISVGFDIELFEMCVLENYDPELATDSHVYWADVKTDYYSKPTA